MRNNQPCTGKAFAFPADQTLISVTDIKGRITYCNSNFVSVSGFTEAELLGQPHNMVRHPDMPAEAFRDMWETLQAGLPWSALVKNRRKNGDHYWVRANASPVRDGDRILGYMSVRTCPRADEVAQAESLYAQMNAELQRGRLVQGLYRGEPVQRTALGALKRTLTLSLPAKLGVGVALSSLLPLVATGLDFPLWAALPLALVLVALVMGWAFKALFAPLKIIQRNIELLAAGDLSRNIPVRHHGLFGSVELALNQLTLGVRTVVRDARHEVGDLRTGSREIAMGSHDMSARTEAQASSLEETAAALEEITGTVRNTAQLAHDGSAFAREATDVSQRSHEAVQSARATMTEIEESSRKIGEILQLIEGVAFQTNILALNAAVEAARAGEQGRGFAVVAAEVRALAQRTTAAARDVRALINESNERVSKGSERTEQALSRMGEAMSAVSKTAALLSQIESASREQELGVSQINQAVAQLDAITQQNAAMSEELFSVAEAQDKHVQSVHNTIRVFKLTDKDKTLAEEDAVALRRKMNPQLTLPDET